MDKIAEYVLLFGGTSASNSSRKELIATSDLSKLKIPTADFTPRNAGDKQKIEWVDIFSKLSINDYADAADYESNDQPAQAVREDEFYTDVDDLFKQATVSNAIRAAQYVRGSVQRAAKNPEKSRAAANPLLPQSREAQVEYEHFDQGRDLELWNQSVHELLDNLLDSVVVKSTSSSDLNVALESMTLDSSSFQSESGDTSKISESMSESEWHAMECLVKESAKHTFGLHFDIERQRQKVIDELFAIGSQEKELLNTFLPNGQQLMELERKRAQLALDLGSQYVINDDSGTGVVPLSSRQQGFRLDSVFRMSKADLELFNLKSEDLEALSDGEAEDNDEATNEAVVRTDINEPDSHQQRLEDLVDEVDRLLAGDTYSAHLKYKGKDKAAVGLSSRKKPADSDSYWAIEDGQDVSDFAQMVPDPIVKYPFDLDTFQKRAIFRLERKESVFVAAHTSAGKTVVAEYAIALAASHKAKAIYTSPIKTLSNQKFREFSKTFQSVGIVTGDVSIHPEADCLVMTTEILRSMLYKGADLIRDIEWVIFDEVHYVNDAERGVVWEEVIIMLPERVGIVMLSATVPNAIQFAAWVGRTKKRRVYVTGTTKRPVPLEHSLLVFDKIFPLYSSRETTFSAMNYKRAIDYEKEKTSAKKFDIGNSRGKHSWPKVIQYLSKEELVPAVIFCFSRKKCEEAADALRTTDLTAGASEKAEIHIAYEQAVSRLTQDDQDVPQIIRMRDLLKRGIGVHHAGLLPIVKEITEILFQRGLIRVLFATETFAMGVNMPARAVVFSNIKKHDGQSFRLLQTGEYIQMAGRAGRRGLDLVGHVLLYFPPLEIPAELEIRQLLTGSALRLTSSFRLTYNMILNLLRVEDLRVEDVIRNSFGEAAAERNTHKLKRILEAGQKALGELDSRMPELASFQEYHSLSKTATELATLIGQTLLTRSPDVFAPGRLLLIYRPDRGLNMAVVVRSTRAASSTSKPKLSIAALSNATATDASADSDGAGPQIMVLVLKGLVGLRHDNVFYQHENYLRSLAEKNEGTQFLSGFFYERRKVSGSLIALVLEAKVKIDPNQLDPIRGNPVPAEILSCLNQMKGFSEASILPRILHPRLDMGINDLDFEDTWITYESIVSQLQQMSHVTSQLGMAEAMALLDRRYVLADKIRKLQWAVSDDSLQLLPDYLQRILVLQRLRYIDDDSVVQLKGRAACEINTSDSLVICEMVFEGILNHLSPSECAALLSAFVFQEKTTEGSSPDCISEEFEKAKTQLDEILLSLGNIQGECGLPVSPLEFKKRSANFGLALVVYRWTEGDAFKDICLLTDVLEGSIVRSVVRLSELIREIRNLARVIGDSSLYTKMETTNTKIKRDIIFTSSLYLG